MEAKGPGVITHIGMPFLGPAPRRWVISSPTASANAASRGALQWSRDAKVFTVLGGPTAVTAPIRRIVNQGPEAFFITEVKTLRHNVAQVLGMRSIVALGITLCIYICHDKPSLLYNFIAGIHTRFLMERFMNVE